MKAKAKIIDELEQRKFKYLEVLVEHYKPIWSGIKKHLEDIKKPLTKIHYLNMQEGKYLQEVVMNPNLLGSSGSHIAETYPHKIGMDALIEIEIKLIVLEYGLKGSYGLQPVPKEKPPRVTEPANSFKYCNANQLAQLESILNLLIKNGFVDDIKLNDFNSIFCNLLLSKIKPIDWKGNSIASLRYFIKQFNFEISDINKYKITAYCFTHKGNKLIYSQIKNAKQVSKKDENAIDNIFKLYPFIK